VIAPYIFSMEDLTHQLLWISRGESQWTTLSDCGINVRRGDNCWEFSPTIIEPIVLSLQDVALGINSLQHRLEDRREWASFMLAASSLFSFEAFDDSDEGDKLLEVLWDFSFDQEPDFDYLPLIRELTASRAN
jgi:hypothetical protein